MNFYCKVDTAFCGKPLPKFDYALEAIGLGNYDIVILTDCDFELHKVVNLFCRKRNIKFISC